MIEISFELNNLIKIAVYLQNTVYTTIDVIDNTISIFIQSNETEEKFEIKFYSQIDYDKFKVYIDIFLNICNKLYLNCKDNYSKMKQSTLFI